MVHVFYRHALGAFSAHGNLRFCREKRNHCEQPSPVVDRLKNSRSSNPHQSAIQGKIIWLHQRNPFFPGRKHTLQASHCVMSIRQKHKYHTLVPPDALTLPDTVALFSNYRRAIEVRQYSSDICRSGFCSV